MSTKKPKTYRRGRDAITGRFVTLETTDRRPKTTVVERVKRR